MTFALLFISKPSKMAFVECGRSIEISDNAVQFRTWRDNCSEPLLCDSVAAPPCCSEKRSPAGSGSGAGGCWLLRSAATVRGCQVRLNPGTKWKETEVNLPHTHHCSNSGNKAWLHVADLTGTVAHTLINTHTHATISHSALPGLSPIKPPKLEAHSLQFSLIIPHFL